MVLLNWVLKQFFILGGCDDGSDVVFSANPLENPPCADGSIPDPRDTINLETFLIRAWQPRVSCELALNLN